MKIKKGDKVKIISGKDKNKEGAVIQVFPELNKIVVEGVNLMKKHIKSHKKGEKGERIELAFPINVAKAMVIDPASGKPTRIGYKMEGTNKVRFAKKSGATLS